MRGRPMTSGRENVPLLTRRKLLRRVGVTGFAAWALPAFARTSVRLQLPGGHDERPITTAFPQKGAMILQRTRPPLLETPF